MTDDLAQALLAGWLSGAVAGMVLTASLFVLLVRHPGLLRRFAGRARLPLIGIVAANALTLGLTLAGLVLGALFHRGGGAEGGADALRFALVVGGVVLAVAGLYVFVRGRVRSAEAPAVLGALAIVGLAFGALLPWLGALG